MGVMAFSSPGIFHSTALGEVYSMTCTKKKFIINVFPSALRPCRYCGRANFGIATDIVEGKRGCEGIFPEYFIVQRLVKFIAYIIMTCT